MMKSDLSENISKKLDLYLVETVDALEQDFKKMLAEHSRDGMLGSGATIKKTMNFISTRNEILYSSVIAHVEILNLKYYSNLEEDIKKIVVEVQNKYKVTCLELLQKSTEIARNPKLYERMLPEVEASMVHDWKNFENSLNVYSLNLKHNRTMSTLEKSLWCLEGLLLAISVFISGMWFKYPNGNYEPIIVALGLLISAIAIAMKIYIKK
ncbi:hypothetical protein [Desulfosediminicola flagellatus]|uniref:hypothetical protein n=1 Tax=Desulfosediminicola flagellatus TaxID=2569541 RepID=UPI0010AD393B|nr:hypothetical protein [Desulfosediminicola flagellatus]